MLESSAFMTIKQSYPIVFHDIENFLK